MEARAPTAAAHWSGRAPPPEGRGRALGFKSRTTSSTVRNSLDSESDNKFRGNSPSPILTGVDSDAAAGPAMLLSTV